MEGNRYYLMRKNEILTMLQLDDNGNIAAFSHNMSSHALELAPLTYAGQPEKWIYKWWEERSIPITRDHIKELLSGIGYTSSKYLVKNLGLSLTDFYWIKPVDSDLTWEHVNLYQNDFHDNILLSAKRKDDDDIPGYSPNSSLQGNTEKTWTIVDNRRCLIKGNHSSLSRESLNEVLAAEIHRQQGYDNYANYKLIRIKGKPYKYGCISDAFTSLDRELLSAWSVVTSEKIDSNTSYYEHFINICGNHGINKDQLRHDLEYQVMVDYILTGYDRHLNNVSILRDADSLKFLRMAPIYDSGDCLFANRELPRNVKELQKMEISGFAKTESKLLKLVTDPYVIDLTKLPSAQFIRDLYAKDEFISDRFTDRICEWYERKIDICRNVQIGRDPERRMYLVK